MLVGRSGIDRLAKWLAIFFAATDQRVQVRIFFRQPRLGSFQSGFAFRKAVEMRRDLPFPVWAIGNELPPGGRRRSPSRKRSADD
jgi:hypothetical protein